MPVSDAKSTSQRKETDWRQLALQPLGKELRIHTYLDVTDQKSLFRQTLQSLAATFVMNVAVTPSCEAVP